MRRIMIAVGLALAGALLAGGCALVGGGNDGKAAKSTSGQQQAKPTPTTSPQAAGPAVSKSVTLPVPGSPGQTVTLGLASLTVKGPLTTLTLVWTPHMSGSDQYSIDDMRGAGAAETLGGVSLIDTVNLKRYEVVKDSNGQALAPDADQAGTGNNQPLTTNYSFATPPGNASIDIYLDDQRIFEAVPVTR